MPRHDHALALGLFAFVALLATDVAAKPQTNAGFLAGLCGRGTRPRYWQESCFYGGARIDAVFGRESPRDFGVGPYIAITTAAFDDVRLGGGATFHLPVNETFPLVLSAGGFAKAANTWEPGASAQLFVGPRSFNYDGSYEVAGGLVAGIDYSFGSSRETVIVIAAQVDAFLLALPLLLVYESLRGPPE